MKNEERELLLKVLCEQLPYGVKVHYNLERSGESGIFSFDRKHKDIGVLYYEDYSEEEKRDCNYDKEHFSILLCGCYYGEDIKPYLRPMSSMTDEEWEEFEDLIIPVDCGKAVIEEEKIQNYIEFCLKHHFDYRGLIEKGLALEAPEGMYKID